VVVVSIALPIVLYSSLVIISFRVDVDCNSLGILSSPALLTKTLVLPVALLVLMIVYDLLRNPSSFRFGSFL
jgi:hypothetical protein